MSSRPAIPKEIAEEVIFEARHRCSACCEPGARSNGRTSSRGANRRTTARPSDRPLCPTATPALMLRSGRSRCFGSTSSRPCALERDRMPPDVAGAEMCGFRALLPAGLHDRSRTVTVRLDDRRLCGVSYSEVRVVSVVPANSCRVVLNCRREAPTLWSRAFRRGTRDYLHSSRRSAVKKACCASEAAKPDEAAVRTDTTEKGLETSSSTA